LVAFAPRPRAPGFRYFGIKPPNILFLLSLPLAPRPSHFAPCSAHALPQHSASLDSSKLLGSLDSFDSYPLDSTRNVLPTAPHHQLPVPGLRDPNLELVLALHLRLVLLRRPPQAGPCPPPSVSLLRVLTRLLFSRTGLTTVPIAPPLALPPRPLPRPSPPPSPSPPRLPSSQPSSSPPTRTVPESFVFLASLRPGPPRKPPSPPKTALRSGPRTSNLGSSMATPPLSSSLRVSMASPSDSHCTSSISPTPSQRALPSTAPYSNSQMA
jgi:hypothetical protein